MKEIVKKYKKELIIFVIYAIVSLIIIFFHEPWRDEAQSWLLAKNLNPIELISQLKYEGHFAIWYLIIMPFAKLNFPYVTQNIISWMITTISVWLILIKAPCRLDKKILIIFSAPMIYLFPTIARCYCLIPLSIVLIAICYKDRKSKPIRYILSIGLLANTHVIMLGMVGILLLEFYIETFIKFKELNKKGKNKIIQSLLLIIMILLLSFMPLLDCLNLNKDIKLEYDFINNSIVYNFLNEIYKETILIFIGFASNNVIITIVCILLTVELCIFLKKDKKDFIEIIIILLWQILIYEIIYSNSIQRASTVILIMFFYAWKQTYNLKIKEKTNRKLKIIEDLIIFILLMMNIYSIGRFIKLEIKYSFSNAYKVGQYISENINENSIIMEGDGTQYCSAIIPYTTNVKFYSIQEQRFFTYTIWNETNNQELTMEKFNETINGLKGKELYYICFKNNLENEKYKGIIDELIEQKILVQIFETDTTFFSDEDYILYKIEEKIE